MSQLELGEKEHISLCEALDRVLNKGVVIRGDITICVAGVELVYLGLNLLLASTEALMEQTGGPIYDRNQKGLILGA